MTCTKTLALAVRNRLDTRKEEKGVLTLSLGKFLQTVEDDPRTQAEADQGDGAFTLQGTANQGDGANNKGSRFGSQHRTSFRLVEILGFMHGQRPRGVLETENRLVFSLDLDDITHCQFITWSAGPVTRSLLLFPW